MRSRGSKRRISLVEMSVLEVQPYLRPERPLLWLGEKGVPAPRLLPIAIGQFEAAAIQMQLDEERPLRPISYDLFAAMVGELGVSVRRVFIHSLEQGAFRAVVVVEQDGHLHEIDCRPSDGIAMALRTRAAIFVADEVVREAGIATAPEEGSDSRATIAAFYEQEPQVLPAVDAAAETTPSPAEVHPPRLREEVVVSEPPPAVSRVEELRGQLERAILCEAYEEAAQLRDEISLLVHRAQD